MDLYEYQARDLFEKYEVPVLAGIVADTPEEVRAAAEKIGGVVVVKAQVKTGGRGKAGGVKVAKTPDEAYEAAKAILGHSRAETSQIYAEQDEGKARQIMREIG